MVINRKHYVDLLLHKRWNRKVKIITGIRRFIKSSNYIHLQTCNEVVKIKKIYQ